VKYPGSHIQERVNQIKEVRGKDDEGVLELFETDETDGEIKGDLFFPLVKEDSKGIRVKVLN
jgi:hypothetical protein